MSLFQTLLASSASADHYSAPKYLEEIRISNPRSLVISHSVVLYLGQRFRLKMTLVFNLTKLSFMNV